MSCCPLGVRVGWRLRWLKRKLPNRCLGYGDLEESSLRIIFIKIEVLLQCTRSQRVKKLGATAMARWSRMPVLLTEDPGSVPNTLGSSQLSVCNFGSRMSNILTYSSGLCRYQIYQICRQNIHTYKTIIERGPRRRGGELEGWLSD